MDDFPILQLVFWGKAPVCTIQIEILNITHSFADLKNKKTELETIESQEIWGCIAERNQPVKVRSLYQLCQVTAPEPCRCEKDSNIQEKAEK